MRSNKLLFSSVSVTILFLLALSGFIAVAAYSASANISNSSSGGNATTDLKQYFVSSSIPSVGFPKDVCAVLGGALLLHCYTPQNLQKAYNFTGAYGMVGGMKNAGAGETIVIFDAYGSPTIKTDLGIFDTTFGLPAPPSFLITCPQGCPHFNTSNPNEVGWAGEVTLDVEYSHAMAPGASILLVVATSAHNKNLFGDEAAIASSANPGNVWSQSFGAATVCHPNPASTGIAADNAVYQKAGALGVTPIASSGDWGAQNLGCNEPVAAFPSSSPFVLAVGGTHLNIGAHSQYASETVWNDFEDTFLLQQGFIAPDVTGGAPSNIFSLPSYQSGISITPYDCPNATIPFVCQSGSPQNPTSRTTSDVAYNADIDGGVLAYEGITPATAGFYIFGGTSAGSPQWAAIIAIADQLHHTSLGLVNQMLYNLAGTKAFHDITIGDNTALPGFYSAFPGEGYAATPGYDAPTGVGTPNVGYLVPML